MAFNEFEYRPIVEEVWELLQFVNEHICGFDDQDGEKMALLLPSILEIMKMRRDGF